MAPDPVGAAAYNGIMDAYVMMVAAHSNRDLTSQEFERQVAMIKPVMNWDQAT